MWQPDGGLGTPPIAAPHPSAPSSLSAHQRVSQDDVLRGPTPGTPPPIRSGRTPLVPPQRPSQGARQPRPEPPAHALTRHASLSAVPPPQRARQCEVVHLGRCVLAGASVCRAQVLRLGVATRCGRFSDFLPPLLIARRSSSPLGCRVLRDGVRVCLGWRWVRVCASVRFVRAGRTCGEPHPPCVRPVWWGEAHAALAATERLPALLGFSPALGPRRPPVQAVVALTGMLASAGQTAAGCSLWLGVASWWRSPHRCRLTIGVDRACKSVAPPPATERAVPWTGSRRRGPRPRKGARQRRKSPAASPPRRRPPCPRLRRPRHPARS